MIWSVVIGLGVVALASFAWWEWRSRKPAPTATATAASVAATIAPSIDQLREDFTQALAGVPALVSQEVADLDARLDTALKRAEQAEMDLAAERTASTARLHAVQAQVGQVIANIGTAPAAAITSPASAPEASPSA